MQEFKSIGEEFVILGYSFGAVVATELAYLLEKNGKRGRMVFIDGAPEYITQTLQKLIPYADENLFQTMLLCVSISRYIPYKTIQKHQV